MRELSPEEHAMRERIEKAIEGYPPTVVVSMLLTLGCLTAYQARIPRGPFLKVVGEAYDQIAKHMGPAQN